MIPKNLTAIQLRKDESRKTNWEKLMTEMAEAASAPLLAEQSLS